jgi:AcrR family transcriptional regulator
MPYTPELTRASVFDSAVREFAAHGFAGARIDRIAREAGVDKTAIYAHFGDKRALFDAVLTRELGRLSEELSVDAADVAGSVGRFFDYQRAHPEHVRLLLWEALEFGTEPVPGEARRGAAYRERFATLAAAQRGGLAAPGLGAAGLWMVLAGMVNWPLILPQLTRMLLGQDEDALERQRDLVMECARRILAPAEEGSENGVEP